MKTTYVCEYCGKQADNPDAIWECEASHVTNFNCYELEPEMRKRYQYKPGGALPERIVVGETRWKAESEPEYHCYVYKYVGDVSPAEMETILKERDERKAQEEAWHAQWRAERERRKAEQEAKAEQEVQATDVW